MTQPWKEIPLKRKHVISNAILWAAAIVASALVGCPPLFTTVLLPALAASALILNRPESRARACSS